MKRFITVGLVTILCSGCGAGRYETTSFGLTLIDSGIKGARARAKKPTIDAGWLTETAETPAATFKPVIDEVEKPVQLAKPTAEQMRRINEMTEKIRREQVEKHERR